MGSEPTSTGNMGSEPTGEEMVPYFMVFGVLGIYLVMFCIWRIVEVEYGTYMISTDFEMDNHRIRTGPSRLSDALTMYEYEHN